MYQFLVVGDKLYRVNLMDGSIYWVTPGHTLNKVPTWTEIEAQKKNE